MEKLPGTAKSNPSRACFVCLFGQVAEVEVLVGVLVHPLQRLECSRWRLRVVQVLVQVHHLWSSGSPPTLQERPQLQPGVHYTVDAGLLCILNLLLSNPATGLLPLCLECVREDAGRLVGAHTQKHGQGR